MNKSTKVSRLLDYIERKGAYPDFYPGIAEHGYDDMPMIAADWNFVPGKVFAYAETLVCADWCDEYMPCGCCGKAVRTQPASYGWTPSWVWVSECETACIECIRDDADLADGAIDYYKNNCTHALPEWFTEYIIKAGFECFSESLNECHVYETGWFSGQDDSPADVANRLKAELPDHDYVFSLNSVGQFDCKWNVFIKRGIVL